jgi:hypothetical protein
MSTELYLTVIDFAFDFGVLSGNIHKGNVGNQRVGRGDEDRQSIRIRNL